MKHLLTKPKIPISKIPVRKSQPQQQERTKTAIIRVVFAVKLLTGKQRHKLKHARELKLEKIRFRVLILRQQRKVAADTLLG